eukprot:3933863-Rhodomonas_salina.2
MLPPQALATERRLLAPLDDIIQRHLGAPGAAPYARRAIPLLTQGKQTPRSPDESGDIRPSQTSTND